MTALDYQAFLQQKRRVVHESGIRVSSAQLPATLFEWQRRIVLWALRKGKAAIFADTGLGKTLMQLAWADALGVKTLILAPLCVGEQTVREAQKIGVDVSYVANQAQADSAGRIVVSNYERLEKFDPERFEAVVLDESSCLKAFDSIRRTAIIHAFAKMPYRLCCTATPSPNDLTELANHAEFLGLMTRPEFLATWFIRIGEGHRTTTHHGWRMKRHAVAPFYRWMASWAVALRKPSDLGYPNDGFDLPPLLIQEHVIPADHVEGQLFPELAVKGLSGRLLVRRGLLADRIKAVCALTPADQWMLWCGLNVESSALAKAIPDAVNVHGSDAYAVKVAAVRAFVAGETRVLISKSKILGFGLNFQHCSRMAFVGLSDSFESYYQCIRRCWRFGQLEPVRVVIVVSEAERGIVENVRRKEMTAETLSAQLLEHMVPFEREELVA